MADLSILGSQVIYYSQMNMNLEAESKSKDNKEAGTHLAYCLVQELTSVSGLAHQREVCLEVEILSRNVAVPYSSCGYFQHSLYP